MNKERQNTLHNMIHLYKSYEFLPNQVQRGTQSLFRKNESEKEQSQV